MAERGTGTITAGGRTTQFRAPTQPSQAVMPQQVSPEELRLKKFYTEQYKVEAGTFSKSAMSQEQFDQGMNKLQAKYKMAFNNAKMRIAQPDPAFKQYSELDIYRDKLDNRLANYNWTAKRGKSKLEIWDPDKGKKGGWTTKGITSDQLEEAMTLTLERNRVKAEQTALLRPGQPSNSIMRTAATSPRMGGAIKDQARALLDQRGGQEQQELDDDAAMQILQEAGGDKEQARQIARSRGYRL